MSQYRKKPVVIVARQLDDNNASGLIRWINENGHEAFIDPDGFLQIKTLEGNHIANIGDWIIQGVKGEFYPCKPDIFQATYEKV